MKKWPRKADGAQVKLKALSTRCPLYPQKRKWITDITAKKASFIMLD